MSKTKKQQHEPLPQWCYIPRSKWTGYHYLMMWSRTYGLYNFKTLAVGPGVYDWLRSRVPERNIHPDTKAIKYGAQEYFLSLNLDYYGVVPLSAS